MPLAQHLEDSAAVAGHLWDTWIADVVRRRVAEDVGSSVAARRLITWLAGIHDVGKATPAFALMARDVKMGDLVDAMAHQGLRTPSLPRHERVRHTITGHLAVEDWLVRQFAFPSARAQALASVVGAHHGVPPSASDIDNVRHTRAMGDENWQQVRDELIAGMADRLDVGEVLDSLRERKLRLTTLIDISALIIIADWIASDADRFPYDGTGTADQRMAMAVTSLDLRRPWRPPVPTNAAALFADRFPHLAGRAPSVVQRAAVAAALDSASAPLLIIEAPTGSGKSEAALMAAEALAARHGSGGVFVALPTMATSNAMFGRVLSWLDRWADSCDPALWLAHGKAALNEDFAGLVRDSRVRAVYDEDRVGTTGARVSGWLSGRKKGLLANVVVGTIDQVLMGGLQARHLALRHLALSSKVVVVDEVHSADTYMRSYLLKVLDYLGAYGAPVVLLSATLPPHQRAELVSAYQCGRQRMRAGDGAGGLRRRTRRSERTAESGPAVAAGPGPEAYPLLTVVQNAVQHLEVEGGGHERSVSVEAMDDEIDTLVTMLDEALVDGGCVAVVRNTVRRAQETFDALGARWGTEVELFHSRFLACERASRERDLLRRLGPGGSDRPQRLVVVGTQVLEQSLDIDLDMLVTDIAPVDLLIQRMGRLHRHSRPDEGRPTRLRRPRCVLTGVETWSDVPPRPEAGTRRVYDEADLYRSLAVLRHQLAGQPVRLPQDAPHLVHRAYDPELLPPEGWAVEWVQAGEALGRKEDRSRSKAAVFQVPTIGEKSSLVGWIETPADDKREEAGRAQVRDTEDGIEVIVVQRSEGGGLRTLPGAFPGAGSDIPLEPEDRHPLTRHIAACTVSLPQSLTNPGRWGATVEALESSPDVEYWQQSRWLAGQLVLILDRDLHAKLNGHVVSYSSERGLDVRPLGQDEDA